jgi:hypothetical protein
MTDDSKGNLYPTAYNITYQLNSLCSKLKPGDQAIFYYSGHGTLVRDKSGDEGSGYDSCVVPLDFQKVGVLSDDTLKYYFNKIPAGVSLFCVFDACHSVRKYGVPSSDTKNGGSKEFIQTLTRSAIASDVDGIFVEVHPEPSKAQCDAATQLSFLEFENLMRNIIPLWNFVHSK